MQEVPWRLEAEENNAFLFVDGLISLDANLLPFEFTVPPV